MNLDALNQQFAQADAHRIIKQALKQASRPLITTHFGPNEAVLLHLVTQVDPNIKVLWIDSGYLTKKTYRFSQQLIQRLQLNIEVYTPNISTARQEAVLGGIPSLEDEQAHQAFTQAFKLEPFRRAFADLKPDVWFTALRRCQTEFRQSMHIFSEGLNGCLKVAPLLHWSDEQMSQYLDLHQLPNETSYYDPTKALAQRECGLHTRL